MIIRFSYVTLNKQLKRYEIKIAGKPGILIKKLNTGIVKSLYKKDNLVYIIFPNLPYYPSLSKKEILYKVDSLEYITYSTLDKKSTTIQSSNQFQKLTKDVSDPKELKNFGIYNLITYDFSILAHQLYKKALEKRKRTGRISYDDYPYFVSYKHLVNLNKIQTQYYYATSHGLKFCVGFPILVK